MSDEGVQINEYLDCTGKLRTFRLQVYANGNFLEAREVLLGEDAQDEGLRFVMPVRPDGLPPWGEMRKRIRERLAQRDIARDPKTKNLTILNDLVRAQITNCTEDDEGRRVPVLRVEDLELSWG